MKILLNDARMQGTVVKGFDLYGKERVYVIGSRAVHEIGDGKTTMLGCRGPVETRGTTVEIQYNK